MNGNMEIDWNGSGIRNPGYSHSLTVSQREEWMKCVGDPVYFIHNYIDSSLSDESKRILNLIHSHRLISVVHTEDTINSCIAYIMWYSNFHSSSTIALTSNTQRSSIYLHERFKSSYENVPHWLKFGCGKWNLKRSELENGSRILSNMVSMRAAYFGFPAFDIIVFEKFDSLSESATIESLKFPVILSGSRGKILMTKMNQEELVTAIL